jgi:hypothetical protein
MAKAKSLSGDNRVSIKGYLLPYLQSVGKAIGTDDLTEVVNHLLTCQRLGCLGSPQPPTAQPVAQSVPDDATLADALGDLLAA